MNTYNNMGLVYIAETTTPENIPITGLKVVSDSVFYVEFDACLHSFDVINRNQRQYLGSNIGENLKTEKLLSLLADNAWYGEMDHPAPDKEGEKLTPERVQRIELSRRSHKIMRPEIRGNCLYGRIQTASGTDCGIGMGKEIVQGLIPRFSCRAIANLQMIDGKPTVIVKKLITYDWVLFPSHKEAGMEGRFQPVSKAVTESVDTCVSLKEIMNYVGNKDANTQMICESFDLDMNSIVGITRDHRRSIIKDGSNTIYANINPDIVKKLNNDLIDLF